MYIFFVQRNNVQGCTDQNDDIISQTFTVKFLLLIHNRLISLNSLMKEPLHLDKGSCLDRYTCPNTLLGEHLYCFWSTRLLLLNAVKTDSILTAV